MTKQWTIDFRPQKTIFADQHLMPEDFSVELILSTPDNHRVTLKLTVEQLEVIRNEILPKR
jgi:hypothetical protein